MTHAKISMGASNNSTNHKNKEAGISFYNPILRSLITHSLCTTHGDEDDIGINLEVAALQNEVDKLSRGDFIAIEQTLAIQADTLDALFNKLAQKAVVHMKGPMGVVDCYMRLALKAQNQCRNTLKALADIQYTSKKDNPLQTK